MTLEEYMRELVLMSRQYGQEEELYPLINMLLRENDNVRHLSVRDVHNKGSKGTRKKIIRGYGTFPDLAIMDEKLYLSLKDKEIETEKQMLYGCVESKLFNSNIENNKTNQDSITIIDIISTGDKTDNKQEIVKWKLDYLYKIMFKKKSKETWSDGYYTASDFKNGQYNEDDINDDVKKLDYITATGKKADRFEWNTYDKYKIVGRGVRINKRFHKDIIQLLSELFWYGKVLYTDGLIWYYLELTEEYSFVDKLKELSSNKIDKDDKRKSIFVDAISSIKDIELLRIELGNLKKIYEKIMKVFLDTPQDEKNKEQRISLSAIGQHIKDEDRMAWARLKYNLASIDWCGTNKAEKFLLKPQK